MLISALHSLSMCLLAMLLPCSLASAQQDLEALPQVALQDAVAWTCEQNSAHMVAWLSDPGASVPWREGADVDEALFLISLSAPAMHEKRGDIHLLSVPPPYSEEHGDARLPGDLAEYRCILRSLPDDVLARLGEGQRVEAEALSARSLAHIRALVDRITARHDPDGSREQYYAALAQGRIAVTLQPALWLCAPGAERATDSEIQLSPRGREEPVAEDWSGTAGWAGWEPPPELSPERLPNQAVTIEPGLHPLADLVFLIANPTGAQLRVAADYADRQVYVNVPEMPAGELLRLIADACYLDLLDRDDGVVVGSLIPHGDWLRMHRQNLEWLLELVKPQTAFPRDSDAARFARVLLRGEVVTVRTMPYSIQGELRPRMIEGREDHILRLMPTFSLCFYPPGSAGVWSIGFR